jgi:hypothetical protein
MTFARSTFVLLLLLAGCAQVREIGGGERDTTAPELVFADPPNLSTGFTGQRILLRFDEKIKVQDVQQQLLISPPLGEAPDVRVQGGTELVIDLKAPLGTATTYSFNLGSAIRDLTEGNPARDVIFVVSTGDHLDSGAVSGRVFDAVSGKPASGVDVLLHPSADSITIRSVRPAYATRTNEQGRYDLRYLRKGTYRIYALRDQNANLRYDLPNEDVAFGEGELELPGAPDVALQLFREVPKEQALLDHRVGPDRDWMLVLAKPVGTLLLRDLDREGGRLSWTFEANATRDTVRCWPNDTASLDGRRFELSDHGEVLDTVRYRVRDRMPFTLKVGLSLSDSRLCLHSDRPLAGSDASRITVLHDSIPVSFTPMLDTLNARQAWLLGPMPTAGTYAVRLLPKALRDIYGGVNDTLTLTSAQPRPEELGTLLLKFDADSLPASGPWMVQLLDGQDRAVRTVLHGVLPSSVIMSGLTPGVYSLKLTQDRNGNGQQDTGQMAIGLQPERAWRHPATFTIRAGWEVEQNWNRAER